MESERLCFQGRGILYRRWRMFRLDGGSALPDFYGACPGTCHVRYRYVSLHCASLFGRLTVLSCRSEGDVERSRRLRRDGEYLRRVLRRRRHPLHRRHASYSQGATGERHLRKQVLLQRLFSVLCSRLTCRYRIEPGAPSRIWRRFAIDACTRRKVTLRFYPNSHRLFESVTAMHDHLAEEDCVCRYLCLTSSRRPDAAPVTSTGCWILSKTCLGIRPVTSWREGTSLLPRCSRKSGCRRRERAPYFTTSFALQSCCLCSYEESRCRRFSGPLMASTAWALFTVM